MTLFRDKNKKAEHLTCWQQDSYCLFKIQTTIQMWENVKYLVVTSKSGQDLQCQVKQIHSNTLCYNLMLDTKGKLAMFSFLMCPHNVSEHWCLFFSWFQWGQSVCGSMWPPREKALHPAPFSKSTAFFVHLQLKISQLFQKKKMARCYCSLSGKESCIRPGLVPPVTKKMEKFCSGSQCFFSLTAQVLQPSAPETLQSLFCLKKHFVDFGVSLI